MNTKRIRMAVMFLLGILLAPLSLQAQNVTVKSTNGNTIAAVKGDGADDTFFGWGGFALWKHNQLNLTMTTADSDGAAMSDIGQFENPANNIFKSSGEPLILGRGNYQDCYVAFSLPKGYRFTGYTIVFRRNIQTPASNVTGGGGNGQASFGEAVPTSGWGWHAGDSTYVTGLQYSASAGRQTIQRTSMSASDMDNVLYFKLINSRTGDNSRVFITLERVEFRFTAEADYTPVTPTGTFLDRKAVDISFSTSTVDLGAIENREYNGSTRVSYSFENVKDLMGKLTMFEEEAVKDGTNYDGISGKVVDYADGGTISSHGNYFKVGRTTGEQVYYIETPTYIEQNDYDKTKNPIGYRIVEAELKYTYGQATPAHSQTVSEQVIVGTKVYPTFTISGEAETYSRQWGLFSGWVYTSNGTQTYYLNASAGMTTVEAQKATWFIDDSGYIRLASNASKYLKNQNVSGTSNRLALVESDGSPARYAINASGQITLAQNANMYLCLNVSNYSGTNYAQRVNYFQMIQNGTYKASRTLTGEEKTVNIYETQTKTLNYPAFTPSDYTLKIYDATGETVVESITVTSTTPDGSIKVSGLNNDAVKFSIEGVGLVQGVVTMQALDPYIDRLNIVCHEAVKDGDMYKVAETGRTLTQTFNSNDFAVSGGKFYFFVPKDFDKDVLFQFEDLYSRYGDNTYYGNTASTNNARYSFVMSPYWQDNPDLYQTSPLHPYTDKVYTYVKGTQAYRFNNADVVGASGGTYQEYPFSLANFTAAGGSFDQLYYTNAEMTTDSHPAIEKIAYLFTCDETRYNIAPTTGIQHRTYAFYQMNIVAEKKEYQPVVTWDKVYDETLYRNGNDVKTDAQWGMKLLTEKDSDGEYGYLTTTQVISAITESLGKANSPTTRDQVLYIDGSELLAIVEDTHSNLAGMTEGLASNVVVFLPVGTSSNQKNFASKTEAGTFLGNGDFELTDMKPFYTPYDIQIDAANKVSYKRAITKDKYGKVQNASLILPFVVALTDGKHTNPDGTSFTMHTMQKDGALKMIEDTTFAYFPTLDNVAVSQANKPYLVHLNENSSEDGISFVVEQSGSTIFSTKNMAADYTFTGETATGVHADEGDAVGTYTFTSTGTYAGQSVPKTDNIFYFAKNQFVCSKDLITSGHVNIAPFRSYYKSTSTANPARLSLVEVIFGEGEGDTDAIRSLKQESDLAVKAGRGTLTIAAKADNQVTVSGMNGVAHYNIKVQAGDVKTVSVPAGIYVVNGVKILVK